LIKNNESERIKKLVEELAEEIMKDNDIETNDKVGFLGIIDEFNKALEEITLISEDDIKQSIKYENHIKLETLIEQVKQKTLIYPSYAYEFIRAISENPYTLPAKLFELDGKVKTKIKVPSKGIIEEDLSLALSVLYPGSITFRYGDLIKIKTGDWSSTFRAHLFNIHTLSTEPLFEIIINEEKKQVFEPILLNTVPINREPNTHMFLICPRCIALRDGDEGCSHTASYWNKTPYNRARIVKKSLSYNLSEKKFLPNPLNKIIDNVSKINHIEVGIVLTGFERSLGNNVNFIEYEPYLGQIIKTNGLSFSIKNHKEIIEILLNKNMWLKRDIYFQIIAYKILLLIKRYNIPEYRFEDIFSRIVNIIKLNSNNINRVEITNDILSNIKEFYQKQYNQQNEPIEANLLNLLNDLSEYKITENAIVTHAIEVYIHTLAHIILIACCITAGTEFNDLDYIINNNEIIIFDNISGGNGSSELIFEYLFKEENFEIEKEVREEFAESTIMNPRFFDSILFELLLPCLNSIVERWYFISKDKAKYVEFEKRWKELENRFKYRENIKNQIIELGINNAYPLLHSFTEMNNNEESERETELFKESIDICIHGCPECSIIGNQCQYGSRLEVFKISKILQNMVLNEIFNEFILKCQIDDVSIIKDLKLKLDKEDFAILEIEFVNNNESEIEDFILRVSGFPINGEYIKNIGQWYDIKEDTLVNYIVFRKKK